MKTLKEQILQALNNAEIREELINVLNSHLEKQHPLVKGDIITLSDNRRYRVIKLDENGVATLLSMFDIDTAYAEKREVEQFSRCLFGLSYANSVLDKNCEKFYENLPEEIKKAIIPTEISQTMYQWFDEIEEWQMYTDILEYQYNWSRACNYLVCAGELRIGERHAFALDISEVYEYVDKDSISSSELNTMFFETEKEAKKISWLRSVGIARSSYAFIVNGDYGDFDDNLCYDRARVRPAFRINVSKVNWTK